MDASLGSRPRAQSRSSDAGLRYPLSCRQRLPRSPGRASGRISRQRAFAHLASFSLRTTVPTTYGVLSPRRVAVSSPSLPTSCTRSSTSVGTPSSGWPGAGVSWDNITCDA